jgi:hypothetical protein
VEFLCALVILPNIVKTLVCISASRGNSPDIIYTAGSATFIVRDNKKLCIKYELEDPIDYVQNHLSKTKWKSLITSAIYNYWSDRINEEIKYYSTLKYFSFWYYDF